MASNRWAASIVVASIALSLLSGMDALGQASLQYVVPQNGDPAPDPSLIDARPDDGTGSDTQGLQTFGDFNVNYTGGTLTTGYVDGQTVLARTGADEVGLRTNGNMNGHGSNANTWDLFAADDVTSLGFRASVKIWAPDMPNLGPVSEFPPSFPANQRYVANGARLHVAMDALTNEAGFGVRTNADGEMVLYASVLYSDYIANPASYEYVIPDLVAPAEGASRNNLHIIDMIVGPSSNQADFYVDGVAVANLQNVAFTFPQVAVSSTGFGDCCDATSNLNWAVEWYKVEAGVGTPHAAPPTPPADPGALWVPDSFGNWNSIANWVGLTVPNTLRGAILGDAITAPRTIVNEGTATTKQITFDSNQGYNLAGSGVYRLEAESGNASIQVLQQAVAGAHQIQGRVQLGSNTTVSTTGGAALSFNNEVDLAGHSLTISGNVNLNHSVIDSVGGGSVAGSGSLATDGATSLAGDLTFDGILPIDIGSADWDQFLVAGTANLAGNILVDVLDGFTPSGSYTIVSASNLIDGGLTLGGPDAGLFSLRVDVDAGTVSLAAVPEPTAIALLAIGLAAFAFRGRARLAALMLAPALFSGPAAYAVVITPVGAVGDSEYADSAGVRQAIYTINGAGLDPSAGDVLSKLHNEASTTELNGGMWMNAEGNGTTGSIVFDLGATYELTDLHVWNQAEYAYVCCDLSTRGAKDVNVYVGDDPNPTTFAEMFTFAQAMHTAPSTTFAGAAQFGNDFNVPGQTLSFTTPVVARYVKFDILNGHGASQIGLSEVRFSGTQVVPATTSWVPNAMGDWNAAANWTDSFIPNTTRGARLGSAITDQRTIINEGTATTKSIVFDNVNGYTLAGSGLYRLQANSGNASIEVLQQATEGAHQFQGKVQLGSNTDITTSGAAVLDFHNQIDLAGKALSIDGNVNINQSVTDSIGGGSISGTGSLGTAGPTSFAGNLTFNGMYSIYIDSENTDRFMIAGTANLTGSISVDVLDSFTPSGSYTIFSAANLINGGLTLGGPDASLFSLMVTPGTSGTVKLVAAAAGVAGDYNGNGVVDAADYTVWRNGGPLQNDPSPGVSPADYTFWRSRFGATSGSGSTTGGGAVPEPTTWAMALLTLSALGITVRGRSQ